jgi:Tol biopolymer transport system component/predicted Ser/Thr protein kinase
VDAVPRSPKPEYVRQLRAIFEAVLDLDPDKRKAYLEQTADPVMRAEVERLLEIEACAGGFLEQPPVQPPSSERSPIFSAGAQIADRFQVVELLGSGGMGQVYRATDRKLNRAVALKVLHSGVERSVSNQQLLAEARAASALNHPNIATIYDFASAEGLDYIAMEFVDGRTLDRVLPSAGLPWLEALRIAQQVAEAFAAAHARGIIHRDLKPANVMISQDHAVKVLDFGIAKWSGSAKLDEGSKSSGDVVVSATFTSGIAGTVAYMSPEQAAGRQVDSRSDIFSLGSVLYEMLTGLRAFERGSQLETLEAILREEPAPISSVTSDVPRALERVVSCCLEKDPAQRFESMAAVAERLRKIGAGREVVVRRSALVAVLLAAAAIFVYTAGRRDRTVVPAGTPSLQVARMSPVTSGGTARKASISPDGLYFAWVLGTPGWQSLLVRSLSGGSDLVIVPPAEVSYAGLTFSEDGNHIYYVLIEKGHQVSTLYRIARTGGPAVAVTTRLDSPVTFSPDGTEFAFVRETTAEGKSSLIVSNASGEQQRVLASRTLPEYFDYPAWSPDGMLIACSIVGANDSARLAVVSVAGGEVKIAGEPWSLISAIGWLRGRPDLIVSGRGSGGGLLHLWSVAQPGGTRNRLTTDLSDYWGVSLTSGGDKLVTVQERSFSGIWQHSVQQQESLHPKERSPLQFRHVVDAASRYARFIILPDRQVLYEEQAGSERRLMVSDGKTQRVLTSGGRNYAGAICPDKRTILYTSHTSGVPLLFQMRADGSNAIRIGPTVPRPDIACSADSQWAIYTAPGAAKWSILWKVRISEGAPVQLTAKPSESPALSPDGRWIAVLYVDERAETHQRPPDLAIVPFDGGPVQRIIRLPPTVFKMAGLKWAPDGNSITYVVNQAGTAEVWAHSIRNGARRRILSFQREQIYAFEWAPDGKSLYVSRGPTAFDVVVVSLS